MSRVYTDAEADQRWCPHCGADCDEPEPLHVLPCPHALGLALATGDETCATCTQPLTAGEPYQPTPNDRSRGVDLNGIRCLPCLFTTTETR